MTTLRIGDATLTRVSYAEVEVEPAQVGLTTEEVASAAAPAEWVSNGKPRASASAWIIEHDDARIVVDPAGAVDAILRNDNDAAAHQHAFASLLDAAGYPRDRITHAVATHLDGVGMLAWRDDDGAWVPFFPNAPILMTQTELDGIDQLPFEPAGRKVLAELQADGAVRGVGDHESITSAVSIEVTGGHSPGHAIVRIRSGGDQAIMVGHLALTPLHLGRVDPDGHVELERAMAARRALLAEDAILIGPLWPAPAAGHWNGTQLVPVSQ